jgi:hypothetical protein
MNTTSNTSLDDKRLEAVVDTQMKLEKGNMLATKLGVGTITTTQKSATFSDVAADQLMDEVPEGGLAPESDVLQGFVAAIPWTEKHKSFSITHDAKKTDQYDMIIKKMNDYTSSIMRTQDYHFGSIFRNSFDTAYNLSDGKPLLSNSHPLKSSGTTSNTFATSQKPLSYESLQEAEDVLNVRMKDHSGMLIERPARKRLALIIPDDSALRDTALQLVVGNSAGLRPGTANNDANYFQKYEGVKYDLYISKCLSLAVAQKMGETTDTYGGSLSRYQTNWWVVDQDMLEDAMKKVQLEGSDVIFEKTTERGLIDIFDFYTFFAYGVTSMGHFAVFGSKGDNSATNF